MFGGDDLLSTAQATAVLHLVTASLCKYLLGSGAGGSFGGGTRHCPSARAQFGVTWRDTPRVATIGQVIM